MPRLTHPDLDGVVIDVDDNKARNRRKAGWVDHVERPSESDTKDVWVAYAQTQSVDPDGLTKAELIDAVG